MKPQKVIVYARASGTDTQNSLLEQVKKCEEYCKEQGLEVARIIKTEGSSENNFPKLLKIILNSKEKIIVVVRTFDRITRQISNYELLKELDEQGKLEIKEVWGIIENKSTAVADFREIFTKTYSQALSKRIRRGIAEKKRKIENYGIQK